MLSKAVAVAGVQKFSFESETESDSSESDDEDEDFSPLKAPKAAGQPDKNAGAVALVSQILRILPEIPLVDNEGKPAVTVEATRQLMALLKPYRTGGSLVRPDRHFPLPQPPPNTDLISRRGPGRVLAVHGLQPTSSHGVHVRPSAWIDRIFGRCLHLPIYLPRHLPKLPQGECCIRLIEEERSSLQVPP